jgi:T-complex protein 1 subunit beta
MANTLQAQNPTQIFAEDVTEEKGENARLSAFVGAIAVGDLVKSTLGPKGMDKILQSAYEDFCLIHSYGENPHH